MNRDTLKDIKAPVYINIEIDKINMYNVSVTAALKNGYKQFPLTSADNDLRAYSDTSGVVVLNASSNPENSIPPYIYALYLLLPKEKAGEILNTIN